MPLNYRILPDRNLIVFTVEGEMTQEDYFQTWEDVFDDDQFKKGMHSLWDITNGSLAGMTNRHVYNLKDAMVRNMARRGDKYRAAAVVDSEVNLGVSRMFQTVARDLPFEFKIFRNYDEALAYVVPHG